MTRVLVVDDSLTDRRLVGGLLEKECNCEVFYASDGEEALHQLELHLPDLVLTDLKMPGLDGLQLVRAVQEGAPLVPVVLMTALGSEEVAVQALQDGAASYVPKSRAAHELPEIVPLVLSAAREERGQSRLMHRIQRTRVELVLENDVSLFPAAVHHLQGLAARMRLFNESDKLRVGVALEEALLNAYYHGNLELDSELRERDYNAYYESARQRSTIPPYCHRRIDVEATLTPSQSTFVIRDDGAGFDPASLPDPTEPVNLERPCGRGVLLMRTFMDEVRFNETGNEVTLVKYSSDDAGEEADRKVD